MYSCCVNIFDGVYVYDKKYRDYFLSEHFDEDANFIKDLKQFIIKNNLHSTLIANVYKQLTGTAIIDNDALYKYISQLNAPIHS